MSSVHECVCLCVCVRVCALVLCLQPVVDADHTRQWVGDPVDEGLWLGLQLTTLGTGHLHLGHLTRRILIIRPPNKTDAFMQATPVADYRCG